ncbi:uncharacterized protein LOC133815186 [Humulus lupulus]|uniref:uncharacterized protein LOC133815186 n=1 Tax=Humulus lupulus TaxID=3486 RepID=UPI002B41197B|nr:uncharacterized protein LOC133815186 [Humulus lupulus]
MNKIGFIDGTIPKPLPSDNAMYNAWYRNNNILISWILNSGSKDISASIIYDESALEIWQDLKTHFQRRNGPHIFNLRRALMKLKQDIQYVSSYYTNLKSLWEELSQYRPSCTCNKCTCGGVKSLQEHYNMEYAMSFLMGLKESYSQVRGNILLMDPLPSMSSVFNLVTQEENQRDEGTQSTQSDSTSNPSMACAFSGLKNNPSKLDSGQYKQYPPCKNRPFFSHCNIHGHTIEKCYKIHGYPPGYNKPRNNTPAAANQL